MTRDDIIRMAREAGFKFDFSDSRSAAKAFAETKSLCDFAVRVAAAEREACAQVCMEKAFQLEVNAQEDGCDDDDRVGLRSSAWLISVCASAIRARGQEGA